MISGSEDIKDLRVHAICCVHRRARHRNYEKYARVCTTTRSDRSHQNSESLSSFYDHLLSDFTQCVTGFKSLSAMKAI